MMLRLIILTLCVLQNIFFTDAQNVITQPPVDSCVPSTATLKCPDNYVPIVRSASYGVSVTDSCVYATGDCIADAMSIMTCTTDSTECSIYVTKRRLSQCSDQEASYIHIEYDCVPIAMGDSAKEYYVCQNGTDITSDNGIIKSPGYPTQFHTTTSECFRAIYVPDNKTIRLWLSDLYIGSTGSNCAEDHLYVVDSIQTFRHCGFRRYAYPYLCSSTIIIQYLITNAYPNYRGMRMYFEVVDRVPNDACPNTNVTVTPIPATTPQVTTIDPPTTTDKPIYVELGIASPIRGVQLCKGDSYTFLCPEKYVVTIIRNMYGVTASDQCELYDAAKHCVVTTDPTVSCLQSCTYIYLGQQIPSCNNKIADYQYIEYQCIPTNTELISNSSCPTDGSVIPVHIDQRGRFQSYGYPNLQTMNCTYRLTTKPGYIMRFYSLDISLNSLLPTCGTNKLTFFDKDQNLRTEFCEQRTFSLIHSSCSDEIDLLYTVTNGAQMLSKGAELYIESQTRPSDWSCGTPLPTTPNPPTTPTTIFTTPTATPMQNETFMFARPELEFDLCFNSLLIGACPAGYTFMLIGGFYGVKGSISNKCGFVQGDCVQEALSTLTGCVHDIPTCVVGYTGNRRRLAHCSDKYADYLHLTTQCVPSTPAGMATVKTYDICDTMENITDIHGVVISPKFPTYEQTNNECKKTIVGVQDRVLKIWINELAVSSGGQRLLNDNSDPNEPDLVIYTDLDTDISDDVIQMFPSIRDTCVNDYLMVNTPHVTYVYCGIRKLAIAPICAGKIQIHYKSTSPSSSSYKGFKLYFEWVEKPAEIICDVNPSPVNTTTPMGELIPDWAQNLELSPILSSHLCLGTSTTLRCPRGSDYVLSIVDSSYGVTGTGLCEIPTSSHCRQETSLGLTCTQSCFIEYNIPRPLAFCGNQNADYLNIDYECIPTRLPNHENPIDICSSTTTDTIAIDRGMMVSPQYPTLGAARSCSKKIQTLNYKLWMVFIVDLFLEGSNDAGECNAASLTIFDGKDKIIRCGLHQPELVLISCSDIVEFQFTSTHYGLGYRGFKVFFQTVDVPPDWACKPTGFTTITTNLPPATTTLIPTSSQIGAYGGTTNGTRQYCRLPFTYQNKTESTCLRTDPPSSTPDQDLKEPWCSLTDNFDIDRQWGFCELGVTDATMYNICRDKTQTLTCPSGYVIDIITADYAAKPDGSTDANACVYDRNDCFQSDTSIMQILCAGLTVCFAYHLSRPLSSCQNRPSAYFHIDYTCVPNDIPEIHKYDMCDSSSVIQNNTVRGFIMSPNFPNTQNNIDCTFNLRILKNHQDIYLYILDMDLNGPNTAGGSCMKDRLLVTADNTVNEICGRSYTNLLVYTCHESVTLQLIRSSDAVGRGVKFYFEFRDKPPTQLCPALPSTTTSSTLSPLPPTSTTTGPLPSYYPDPSPRMFKTLCYPDLSGLMGAQNFQCPTNYVINIHRAFYGKSSTRCDYTSGDCTSEADLIYRTCSGKQSCSVSFINIVLLPECLNEVANYLFVEYQCLPTPTIAPHNVNLCTGKIDGGGISGVLKSTSYPTYTQTQCPNNTLSSPSDSNLVIYMYILDFDIGSPNATGQCSNDYLLLSYQCNNQLYNHYLCGTHHTRLLFSTCQPTDQIFASYNLISQNSQAQRGFALLYHLLPKSDPITGITTPSTTPYTSPTPSGPGPISTSIEQKTSCVPHPIIIECTTPEYVLVVHKVQLGVNPTNSCTYSPSDCFEDRTNSYNYCGGKKLCDIFPPAIPINICNNSIANYLYVEYQCIPKRPKLYLDTCSSTGPTYRVQGGAMVTSVNYTSENKQCSVMLQSDKLLGSDVHKSFKVYILSLNLPMRSNPREQGAQCSETDPYIDIDDHELAVTRLCGNSHTRYLLETCSTMIEVRYNNIQMDFDTGNYNGFELYFESIQHDDCAATSKPLIPTEPLIIKKEVVCALADGRERVDFSCTPDHGLVFLQSYNFVTQQPEQCNITQHTCFYPSEQPQAQCAGQQACSYTHTTSSLPESDICQDKQPDSVEFYYQCLPMRPTQDVPTYTFCSHDTVSGTSGFIETPGYPNTYQLGKQNCSLNIRSPDATGNETYSIYLYAIELSIRDTSIINSSAALHCFDSIGYTDGEVTHFLCGKIDQPLLKYQTNRKQVQLTLNIPHESSSDEWNTWHGARLFFIIGNQVLPAPPMIITTLPTITTTNIDQTSTPSGSEPMDKGIIASIVIVCMLAVVAILLAFVYYRRRSQSRNQLPPVTYAANMDEVNGTTASEEKEQRSSIPAASLKGPAATTFVSPFYKKQEANGTHQIEDETFA